MPKTPNMIRRRQTWYAVLLCGEVNAKNSFGGYTGYSHFTYLAGYLFVNKPAEGCVACEIPFNKYWNEGCKP